MKGGLRREKLVLEILVILAHEDLVSEFELVGFDGAIAGLQIATAEPVAEATVPVSSLAHQNLSYGKRKITMREKMNRFFSP